MTSQLPRALGIAATLNEVTFVLGPVAASGLGSVSPAFALVVVAGVSALPALLVPSTKTAPPEYHPTEGERIITPAIALWLMCSAAGGAAVAAIEIGAVAMAISFGYKPGFAIAFTVPLCLASVAGGIWVSVRNNADTGKAVVWQLSVMAFGTLLAAVEFSLSTTVMGASLIGAVLAPLATHYSLALDRLTPSHRKPEVFALLRTANALGVIVASGFLTMVSLSVALILVATLTVTTTITVSIAVSKLKGRGMPI